MSEKFHNYKFKIKEMNPNDCLQYHKIKVCVEKSQEEVYFFSENGDGNHSVYLQDRFFNFNVDSKTKNICSFEGELKTSDLKLVNLQMPKRIKDVVLSINSDENLQSGCGSYVRFKVKDICYDQAKKILQIGEINQWENVYKFLKNAFAQVKNDQLKGLMFTEIEM